MEAATYRIRQPEVVSEVFEGEAVVVNLRVGRYYAMSPLASELWSRLELQPDLESLVACSTSVWMDASEARRELETFLGRLQREGLIELSTPPPAVRPELESLVATGELNLEFEVFTDLEDLLVLDPIHDLDEGGWPVGKSNADPDQGA